MGTSGLEEFLLISVFLSDMFRVTRYKEKGRLAKRVRVKVEKLSM